MSEVGEVSEMLLGRTIIGAFSTSEEVIREFILRLDNGVELVISSVPDLGGGSSELTFDVQRTE